jgi:sugar phosphate permease
MAGFLGITSQAYFYVNFVAIGIVQSPLWPSYIAVLGNWFPRKNRGFLVGLWATAPNVGNIIGI